MKILIFEDKKKAIVAEKTEEGWRLVIDGSVADATEDELIRAIKGSRRICVDMGDDVVYEDEVIRAIKESRRVFVI